MDFIATHERSTQDHSLVLFQGLTCAVGDDKSNTLECFDPNTNKWTYLPRMKTDRRRAAEVELNGELYVTGGEKAFDFDDVELNSVEKYNPDLKTWIEVEPIKEERGGHTTGVFNGKIYVIGGGSNLVEAYDPSNNAWINVGFVEGSKFNIFTAV